MGGFTINGCGATDSYYPMKDLGTFQCPFCGQNCSFKLEEIKRKIRVLYIPTASINTKFGVFCSSCGRGFHIEEQSKEDILYDRVTIEMTAEGLTLRKKGKPAVIDAAEPREIPEWSEEASTPKPGRRRFCGQCGSRLDEQTGLCPVCSGAGNTAEVQKKISGVESTVQGLTGKPRRKVCPVCGLIFSADKTNCAVCGSGLEDRE